MRFVIDLEHGPDGHVAGLVIGPDGGDPAGFDGWLQLLRMLAITPPMAALTAEESAADATLDP